MAQQLTETQKISLKMLSEANQRARTREIQTALDFEREIADIKDTANQQETRANNHGFQLVKTRKVNQTEYTQIIKGNMLALIDAGYLTTAEQSILMTLSVFLDLSSNFLMKHKKNDKDCAYTAIQGSFLTLADIEDFTGLTRRTVSALKNSLIEKGILYEVLTSKKLLDKNGRTAGAVPLIINPELMYIGDRNKINSTLCELVMQSDVIEKTIKLPYKIWRANGAEFGQLISRHEWLHKKRQIAQLEQLKKEQEKAKKAKLKARKPK